MIEKSVVTMKGGVPVLALMLSALVILIDSLAEQAIALHLQGTETFIKVTPFLNLVWVGNDGVSFGLLQGVKYGRWLLSAFALIITGFFFIWLLRTKSLRVSIALGLIIGGALGNTFERLVYGYVIDVLDFHAYGYHWPAFNLTDSSIVCGAVLLIYNELSKTYNAEDLKKKGEK